MVDVPHHHHHRASLLQVLVGVGTVVDKPVLDGYHNLFLDLRAYLHGDHRRGVVVYHFGDGGHNAQIHKPFYDLGGGYLKPRCQLAHLDVVGYGYLKFLASLTLYLKAP